MLSDTAWRSRSPSTTRRSRCARSSAMRDPGCDGRRNPAARRRGCDLDHDRPVAGRADRCVEPRCPSRRAHQLKHSGWTPGPHRHRHDLDQPRPARRPRPPPHDAPLLASTTTAADEPPALPDPDQLHALDTEHPTTPSPSTRRCTPRSDAPPPSSSRPRLRRTAGTSGLVDAAAVHGARQSAVAELPERQASLRPAPRSADSPPRDTRRTHGQLRRGGRGRWGSRAERCGGARAVAAQRAGGRRG